MGAIASLQTMWTTDQVIANCEKQPQLQTVCHGQVFEAQFSP